MQLPPPIHPRQYVRPVEFIESWSRLTKGEEALPATSIDACDQFYAEIRRSWDYGCESSGVQWDWSAEGGEVSAHDARGILIQLQRYPHNLIRVNVDEVNAFIKRISSKKCTYRSAWLRESDYSNYLARTHNLGDSSYLGNVRLSGLTIQVEARVLPNRCSNYRNERLPEISRWRSGLSGYTAGYTLEQMFAVATLQLCFGKTRDRPRWHTLPGIMGRDFGEHATFINAVTEFVWTSMTDGSESFYAPAD